MRKILIVDDDPVNRELLRWPLEDEFEIHELKNGVGAAQLVIDGDFSLVLLDVMMPIVDGEQVVRDLAALSPAHLPRIVVVSAAMNPELQARLSNFAVAGCFERPYDPDQVLSLVNAHLG